MTTESESLWSSFQCLGTSSWSSQICCYVLHVSLWQPFSNLLQNHTPSMDLQWSVSWKAYKARLSFWGPRQDDPRSIAMCYMSRYGSPSKNHRFTLLRTHTSNEIWTPELVGLSRADNSSRTHSKTIHRPYSFKDFWAIQPVELISPSRNPLNDHLEYIPRRCITPYMWHCDSLTDNSSTYAFNDLRAGLLMSHSQNDCRTP